MKNIMLKEYNQNMGILIDIRKRELSKLNPIMHSINVEKDYLLMNYRNILNKQKKYFIVCENGKRSKEVVRILEYYGYDVTNVIN